MPRKLVGSEADIQLMCVRYAQLKYPDVIIRSDYASGLKLTIGQAKKHKALQGGVRAWPDMQFPEPIGIYAGLFIELKKDGVKLLRDKDARKVLADDYKLRLKGDWWDLHTEEQAEMLERLRDKGYAATFAVGYTQFCERLDAYMAGRPVPYVTTTTAFNLRAIAANSPF